MGDKRGGKGKKRKERKHYVKRTYSFPPSQISSFHSFSSSPTARQNHKEFQFTDSLQSEAEEIIPQKGIKVVGFSCSVILTWKLVNICLRHRRNEIKDQKELVFWEEISIYKLGNHYRVITKRSTPTVCLRTFTLR